MEDRIQILLDEAIEQDIRSLSNMNPGTDQRSKTIEELNQLHKMRIEEAKIEVAKIESRDKMVTANHELEAKKEQLKSQNLDRLTNLGLQAGLTVGGWIVFSIWQRREQIFELNGTPTSPIFRGLLSRMIPKIK